MAQDKNNKRYRIVTKSVVPKISPNRHKRNYRSRRFYTRPSNVVIKRPRPKNTTANNNNNNKEE